MPLITFDYANRKQNKIALTFDDGPNPFWTKQVLDLLDEYKIKANFFVLGKWAKIYPEIVKDVFNRGHLIGNHGYSHSKEVGDFEKAEEIIFNIIGEHSGFVRAPYLNPALCVGCELVESGWAKIIGTDVFPRDYKREAAEIVDFAIKNTQNGSIILLHDGSNHKEELLTRPAEMFAALPKIIAILQTKFEFRRLDEMEF